MKSDEQTLQIEITIAPAKGRQRHSVGGPTVPDPPRIPRITRLMALAIKFQDMVDRAEVRDYADLARLGYVSRARITQIMNLLHLAPDIQEQLLSLVPNEVVSEPIAERHIRHVASAVDWCQQRRRWNAEE
jgi:hypothetical protein